MGRCAAKQRSRRSCLALLAGGLLLTPMLAAHAQPEVATPPELATALPGASLRGGGAMRFLGLRIFDARLWTPTPIAGDIADQPLALELIYARSISGAQIVSSSLREMARVGSFSEAQATRWSQAMAKLFPDVSAGDRITGVQRPGQSARFFFNGILRGEVADALFTRLFFGIWLSARTSEPQLRQQLLNGGS